MRSLVEFLADVLLGHRCPICDERTHSISFHLRFDHADQDEWPA